MPFDAVFLSAVTQELQRVLQDGRIDKIQQPERDALILQLRGREGNCKLLLSASPTHPRVHLTQLPLENPAQPPMFCMLLRKHLTGAKILELVQQPLERAFELLLQCTDELGEQTVKRLILEIMGHSSNLILVNSDGRIVDCLRRVDFEQSQKRQILPGLFYQPPIPQEKRNPLETSQPELLDLLQSVDHPVYLDKWLLDTFTALPPLLCRELCYGFCGDVQQDIQALSPAERSQLADYLSGAFSSLQPERFSPTMLIKDGKPFDFTYRPIFQYEALVECRQYPSFSQLLDGFYGERDRSERVRQRSQSIHKTIVNLRDRVTRKLLNQRKELEATLDRDRLRQLGDIVTANLHLIDRGQARLSAVDFYDPDMQEIDIPLSPLLSPQQNAAKFYKDYTKAKHAEQFLTEQIAKGEQELEYLSSVLEELSRAEGEKDISEIRQELVDGGYLRQAGQKKKMKTQPAKPLEFRSSDGFTIFVGRNNRQNDLLTTKQAFKSDLWLHTQKIHGSHVIVACNGQTPPDKTVTEAAMLAAWFSQARSGQNVPVDYTLVKNVKKPGGSKPGMVIYDHYNTCFVTPTQELAEQLRV